MKQRTEALNVIEDILNNNKLLDIKAPLESKGFKVVKNIGDMPMPPLWFEVSKDGEEYTILNKNYIELGTEEFIVGQIAVG